MEDSFKSEEFVDYIKENMPDILDDHNLGINVEKDGFFVNDEIHVINYLKENRINFNFRQVYPKKEDVVEKSAE